MPKYYIKFTGAAWDIEAASKPEAIRQIEKVMHCYCSPTAYEIGKDVDEYGYPKQQETKAVR